MDSLFGWRQVRSPQRWYDPLSYKRSTYNSVLALAGCYCLADSWWQFAGLVLLIESIIVSIEGCWPRAVYEDENGEVDVENVTWL